MPYHFSTVAFLGNTADPRVADCMAKLAAHLSHRAVKILLDEAVAIQIAADTATRCAAREFATRADLIVAIGGDGTLLYAARLVAGHSVPLLGINRGRLGFLTDVSAHSMLEDVDTVLEGRYQIDNRAMLNARIESPGRAPAQAYALNDIVIQKHDAGRMLDFETSINGSFVNSHGGDGLVVATATGSTAYALSCGGPIIEPNLDVWVLAPICPHTLSDRPIVVHSGSRIMVRVLERPFGRAHVTCDGEPLGELGPEERLHVEKADRQITLLHPQGYDYYRLLRSKLHWGRGGFDAGPAE